MAIDNSSGQSDIESFFPPNPEGSDGETQFWTISDDDFEPDTTLLPDENQLVYGEDDEVAARDEEPIFSPEEEEYLRFLENPENPKDGVFVA
jgi:hypothetical protein